MLSAWIWLTLSSGFGPGAKTPGDGGSQNPGRSLKLYARLSWNRHPPPLVRLPGGGDPVRHPRGLAESNSPRLTRVVGLDLFSRSRGGSHRQAHIVAVRGSIGSDHCICSAGPVGRVYTRCVLGEFLVLLLVVHNGS